MELGRLTCKGRQVAVLMMFGLFFMFMGISLSGCSKGDEKEFNQLGEPRDGETICEFMIDGYGSVYARLFTDEAPKAAGTFVERANEGRYDGVPFDIVFKDYVMQVTMDGDFELFEDEMDGMAYPYRGALCFANMGVPDSNPTNGSFFIVLTPADVLAEIGYLLDEGRFMSLKEYLIKYYQVDLDDALMESYMTNGGAPWLTGRHTVFGQVYEGMEVLDEIASREVDEHGALTDEVIISKVLVTKY